MSIAMGLMTKNSARLLYVVCFHRYDNHCCFYKIPLNTKYDNSNENKLSLRKPCFNKYDLCSFEYMFKIAKLFNYHYLLDHNIDTN